MRTRRFLYIIMAAVIIFAACKKEEIKPGLNDVDLSFINNASINDSAELRMALKALATSHDTILLPYVYSMIGNYQQARKDLKIMGTVVGFSVKDTIDRTHLEAITELDTLTGRSFDSLYIHKELSMQQAAFSFYIDEVTNGSQPNVKAFANTYLEQMRLRNQRADSLAKAFY